MLRHLRAVAKQKTDCQVLSILAVARKMELSVETPPPAKTKAKSIPKDGNGVIDFDAASESRASVLFRGCFGNVSGLARVCFGSI